MNQVNLSFSASLDNVNFSRSVLVGFLMNINPDLNFINELKTVVSEAVTNCIIHGYNEDNEKLVFMNIKYDEENVYLEIIDYGIGIEDIDKAKEPLFSSKLEEERAGLGFTIMEVFTDEMTIESKVNEGTKLMFKKRYKEN